MPESMVVTGLMRIRNLRPVLILAVAAAMYTSPLLAHPHVFAEARLNIEIDGTGTVSRLSHVWRFDEIFSETVMFEFDKDADGKISAGEQAQISTTIVESIGEYNYFEAVIDNGKEVKMAKPADLVAAFDGKTLVVSFSNAPVTPLKAAGKVSFGIYDPTVYTAIDFLEDSDMKIAGAPAPRSSQFIRPDPEEATAQN
ncbi:MAG: DUF1007 family protein, partial [Novosphingobium sp.]|nr:DUF1007 family protein [Novosphingobium sp.]